jgi:aryl-alcohol dehydrogenase-like predicted oxidoreductase
VSIKHPALSGITLVLGGNVFGWTADRDASFEVLDAYYELGGRMIDTADVYSAWVPGHQGGESERMIGAWLKDRGVRKDMRIHTKTGMQGGVELYEPARVLQSLEASLERLQTDYIDLYYAHRDYEELPVADIVSAFDGAAKTGKVRALGASNFTTARFSAALDAADAAEAMPFTVLQNEYNLVHRDDYGPDLQALCQARGIAMLPFYSLAAGYLTGKYRDRTDLAGKARGSTVKKYIDKGLPVLKAMDPIVKDLMATHAQVALAWLIEQPGIDAPIASATTADQVDDLAEMLELELSAEQLASLTAAN